MHSAAELIKSEIHCSCIHYKCAKSCFALYTGVAAITEVSGAAAEEEKQTLPAHEGAYTVRRHFAACGSQLNLCLAVVRRHIDFGTNQSSYVLRSGRYTDSLRSQISNCIQSSLQLAVTPGELLVNVLVLWLTD